MPVLTPANLVGISNDYSKTGAPKHSISFAYNWVGDVVKAVSLGGVSFQGSSAILDVSSIPSSVAKLPAFRTLQITQSFDLPDVDGNFDGELVISVSGTNQLFRFAPQYTAFPTVTSIVLLTAIVPIVANAPTKITFAKGADTGGAMFGLLTASIFDFDLAPMVYCGSALQ